MATTRRTTESADEIRPFISSQTPGRYRSGPTNPLTVISRVGVGAVTGAVALDIEHADAVHVRDRIVADQDSPAYVRDRIGKIDENGIGRP